MTSKSPDSRPESTRSGEATSPAVFVVDRRENNMVILVNDAGNTIEVEASRLPADCCSEGAVLRVPLGLDSAPVWNRAVRDRSEEKRRLSLLAERLEKLRGRDPGGDVSL